MSPGGVTRMLSLALAGALMLGTSGCMSLIRNTARSYDVAPNGLSESDDAFRRALSTGAFGEALRRSGRVKDGAPQDALLRALYRGTSAFHSGDYTLAVASFAEADRLAEERETRSLSRHAAALVTNDQVLPYLPSRTERLFTRYYAMMSYVRANDISAAAVEARRLGLLLQSTQDSIGENERAVHALLRDAAGAVFEAAGERNDALVSYRNAALLRGASPQVIDSISLAQADDSATIVVFVESGFVAHRVNQELSFAYATNWNSRKHDGQGFDTSINFREPPVPETELNLAGKQPITGRLGTRDWSYSDSGFTISGPMREPKPKKNRNAAPDIEPVVLARQLADALDVEGDGVYADEFTWRRKRHVGSHFDGASTVLSLAWPALLRTRFPAHALQVVAEVASDTGPSMSAQFAGERSADISDAIAADYRRALPMILTRLVARAVAKTSIADAVGDKHGWWAGTLASLAGDVLERADTRSWHLLPGDVRVVRLRVPAGAVQAHIRLNDASQTMQVPLPDRPLEAGEVVVANTRVFRATTFSIR